jgi:hypothetical protein
MSYLGTLFPRWTKSFHSADAEFSTNFGIDVNRQTLRRQIEASTEGTTEEGPINQIFDSDSKYLPWLAPHRRSSIELAFPPKY